MNYYIFYSTMIPDMKGKVTDDVLWIKPGKEEEVLEKFNQFIEQENYASNYVGRRFLSATLGEVNQAKVKIIKEVSLDSVTVENDFPGNDIEGIEQ